MGTGDPQVRTRKAVTIAHFVGIGLYNTFRPLYLLRLAMILHLHMHLPFSQALVSEQVPVDGDLAGPDRLDPLLGECLPRKPYPALKSEEVLFRCRFAGICDLLARQSDHLRAVRQMASTEGARPAKHTRRGRDPNCDGHSRPRLLGYARLEHAAQSSGGAPLPDIRCLHDDGLSKPLRRDPEAWFGRVWPRSVWWRGTNVASKPEPDIPCLVWGGIGVPGPLHPAH